MRRFQEIFDIAAKRKGGEDALEALLCKPLPREVLIATPDDRWLSAMARCLFEAGFNWAVIDAKWPGFEAAFDVFAPERVGFYHDGDLDRLLKDKAIVRNAAKISAVIDNARFVRDLAVEHGSAARFFADWPNTDYIGLLALMTKCGARQGGVTGQRMLRRMGRDSFILSTDVVGRLVADGVVEKAPASKRSMQAVQDAFNCWADQSGRSFTEISQILAFSV